MANYTKIDYDYTINTLNEANAVVTIISVNPRNRDCVIVTRRSKVTLQGVPSHTPPQTSSFNVVDQLKKTPAQISLFELLHISPSHIKILDKALQDSVV